MPKPAPPVNPADAHCASAHVDTFARDRLPAAQDLPDFLFELPELQFGPHLNCATDLLDRRVAQGDGGRLADRPEVGHAFVIEQPPLARLGHSQHSDRPVRSQEDHRRSGRSAEYP